MTFVAVRLISFRLLLPQDDARNLVVDHHRRRQRQPVTLAGEPPAAEDQALTAGDAEFVRSWREKLLAQALEALAAQEHGQSLAAVLQARIENPATTAGQLAQRLAGELGQSIDDGWIRKRLHYARKRFAALLIELVQATLDEPSLEDVTQELIDLELYERCREALTNRAAVSDQ